MKRREFAVAAACLGALAAFGGCSDGADPADDASSAPPVVETTETTEATTTTEVTTTTEAEPDYPTYDVFVASLPPGTQTCRTRGEVAETDDGFTIGGVGAGLHFQGMEGAGGGPSVLGVGAASREAIFCPGARLTAGDPFSGVNQFGAPLERGALFSVDLDGSFVQVSSF